MIKIGDIIEIIFLDHVEDGEKPLKFIVYGRIKKIKKDYISVESWAYYDKKLDTDLNCKLFTILKSCIIKINKLKG
jgi:hypothetical protein